MRRCENSTTYPERRVHRTPRGAQRASDPRAPAPLQHIPRYWEEPELWDARKNRKFDGEVMLEPGTYVVHYETDGSHSWPDRRPPDPRNWGITVTTRAERH